MRKLRMTDLSEFFSEEEDKKAYPRLCLGGHHSDSWVTANVPPNVGEFAINNSKKLFVVEDMQIVHPKFVYQLVKVEAKNPRNPFEELEFFCNTETFFEGKPDNKVLVEEAIQRYAAESFIQHISSGFDYEIFPDFDEAKRVIDFALLEWGPEVRDFMGNLIGVPFKPIEEHNLSEDVTF